jgi:hypothetical protein
MPLPFSKSTEKKERKPSAAPKKLPVTRKACDAVVQFVNLGWQISPWRAESLDETEQEALARSLYAAAQSNTYLGNIIARVTSASAEGQLAACLGAIVAVRLANHQIVPPMVGLGASFVLTGIAGEDISNVETGSREPGPDVTQGDMPNGAGVSSEAPPDFGIGDFSLAESADFSDLGFGPTVEVPPLDAGIEPIRRRRSREQVSRIDARGDIA